MRRQEHSERWYRKMGVFDFQFFILAVATQVHFLRVSLYFSVSASLSLFCISVSKQIHSTSSAEFSVSLYLFYDRFLICFILSVYLFPCLIFLLEHQKFPTSPFEVKWSFIKPCLWHTPDTGNGTICTELCWDDMWCWGLGWIQSGDVTRTPWTLSFSIQGFVSLHMFLWAVSFIRYK